MAEQISGHNKLNPLGWAIMCYLPHISNTNTRFDVGEVFEAHCRKKRKKGML